MADIAVIFVIREKFSWALAALKRLYAIGGEPFVLYLVDGLYPAPVRAEIDAWLGSRPGVVRIRAQRFLYPSEAFNLALPRVAEPYVCLVQNDVLIGRGALRLLADTARELRCDAVVPRMLDTDAGQPAVHRDTERHAGIVERGGRIWLEEPAEPKMLAGRRRVHHFELHCLLMTAPAAREATPLPPLSSREHIDLALRLWRAGRSVYLDQRAQAMFMDSPPLRLRDFDCDFYRFRWNVTRARQSHQYVLDTWRLADMRDAMPFVLRQQQALDPASVRRGYAPASEPDPWPSHLEPPAP